MSCACIPRAFGRSPANDGLKAVMKTHGSLKLNEIPIGSPGLSRRSQFLRAFESPQLHARGTVVEASGHDFGRQPVHTAPIASGACPLALASPRACPFGGACHSCPTRALPKLAVSRRGDSHEREASQTAETIIRMIATPLIQPKSVRRGLNDEKELQRNATPDQGSDSELGQETLAGVHEVLRSPGQPMDLAARALFEPRFGRNFSQVRIHADSKASESARAVNARAYTIGDSIVFEAGQYAPTTHLGQELLAHELTHVCQQSNSNTLALQREEGRPTQADASSAARGGEDEGPLAWLIHFLREVVRVFFQMLRMPNPLPRETSRPRGLRTDCLTFNSRAELDAQKVRWTSVIAAMPVADVVRWITGVDPLPAAASTAGVEATRQKDCMLFAIGAAARAGSTIHLPPRSQWTQSSRRDFPSQSHIWQRKFEFWTLAERRSRERNPRLRTAEFDRISSHARSVCGNLIGTGETRWNPDSQNHRLCWGGVAPLPGRTFPAMPTGSRSLNADERQEEILQASAAPGISRHHWGTDFDLFDPQMNPQSWEAGETYADEYSWLMNNAATYGFMQPFTIGSTFMRRGYMEERWHWSYWPVSQALFEFARAHQSDIETQLTRRWGSDPQFSFIRAHWREYMFNVSEGPRI